MLVSLMKEYTHTQNFSSPFQGRISRYVSQVEVIPLGARKDQKKKRNGTCQELILH